jgi:hypothetical protein
MGQFPLTDRSVSMMVQAVAECQQSALPQPICAYVTHGLDGALQPSGVYRMMKRYAKRVGITVERFGPRGPLVFSAITYGSETVFCPGILRVSFVSR